MPQANAPAADGQKHTNRVKTGDDTPVMLLWLMLISSGWYLLHEIMRGKRNKKEE